MLLSSWVEIKMEINKTKIEKRMQKKSDSELVSTIIKLKKTNPDVAKELAKPKRRWSAINLKELSHVDGDLVVAGKVLSAGELSNKKKIVAWSFSEKAKEKIKEAKGEAVLLIEEMKNNPELNGFSMVK
jgi:ribosomal protein L18E